MQVLFQVKNLGAFRSRVSGYKINSYRIAIDYERIRPLDHVYVVKWPDRAIRLYLFMLP